ncbi:MAG TPA: galactokinase family protein [Verrucomicrobiae bacterium]|nr:galactokinase family protein [Verrucomicrobiae bacterium]
MPASAASPLPRRSLSITDATSLFKKHFGHVPVHLVRAPGRLELLGNHTDYNEGLVMSVAVDKYTWIASEPRTDGKIELVSAAFPNPEQFWADDIRKNAAAPWANYVKGVLDQLRKKGVHFGGFNAAVYGDIPMGAGMSSSASLEVGTAITMRRLYPFTLGATGITAPPVRDASGRVPPLPAEAKLFVARLCQAAENQFVGVQSGLLDQISSLCGKAWNVMSIDFRSLSVGYAPISGEAIIICNSGVKHELVGGEYNELRRNCESAAHKLGATSLRTIELKTVEARRASLSEREYECAKHVTGEIQRVVAGERALRGGDHRQFGAYMFESHASSRDFLKNSTAELDLLVELARAHPACLGARLTGGGFGGATINLVTHHEAEGFMKHMSSAYEAKTGIKMTPLLCQVVDGAE